MPPVAVYAVDPEMRAAYEANLPTRKERRKLRGKVLEQCANYNECGITRAGTELRTCSSCKLAKYCSTDCQKSHWRNGHKAQCTAPELDGAKNLPLRLAKRGLASSYIVEYYHDLAITVLDLVDKPRRSDWRRYAVRMVCAMQPADMTRHLQHMINGHPELSDNEPKCLQISRTIKVLIDDLPEETRRVAIAMREKVAGKKGNGHPLMTYWFTLEGDGDECKSFTSSLPLSKHKILWLNTDPPNVTERRSPLTGTSLVPRTEELIREGLNIAIRHDIANTMHLRVFPDESN